jgi:MerR family transcriptional regulator/heat shock protein HspR
MRPERDAPVYVISVAAKLTGLPAWMLRLLDQEGIVVPTRTDKNRRVYSDNDISRLERIRYLTEERGVNMAGVRVILEMEETNSREAEVQERDEIRY